MRRTGHDPDTVALPADSDPATGERWYTEEEDIFLKSCECYRIVCRKRFLRATDYLKVVKCLGYRVDCTLQDLRSRIDWIARDFRRSLSVQEALNIRRRYREGVKLEVLAQSYGVAVSTIWKIVNRQRYVNLEDE